MLETARGRRTRSDLREQAREAARLLVPRATYRLQFHADFTFQDACKQIPYLHRLGISHLYASPYVQARSGSTHGYDVANPNALNPELGTEDDYASMVRGLNEHGMYQLVDVVPNHMGIGDPTNVRWLDVLENGPASRYAEFFDINWAPLKAGQHDQGRVVLPVLGDQYGAVLENGELQVCYDSGALWVCYYEHRFPLAPDTFDRVLRPALYLLAGNAVEHELRELLGMVQRLPARGVHDSQLVRERSEAEDLIKQRLAKLHDSSAPFRKALDATLDTLNGHRDDPSSFDDLDDLIQSQSYRLAFWRVAAEEINYRRFFDVAELAAVRMEDPRVFAESHRLLLRLVGEGAIHGLRIDHPDGLQDPAEYLWRLQQRCFEHSVAPGLGGGSGDGVEGSLARVFEAERARRPASPLLRSFYVVVEKILVGDERLRPDWPVAGTTGYDFLNAVNGLFVDQRNERAFTTIYERFTRQTERFEDVANTAKKLVMLISLASEVNELSYQLKEIAGHDRRHQDFTLNGLTFAIREVIAALPVYRTYINPETGEATAEDRAYLAEAVAEAKRRNPRTDPSLFQFVIAALFDDQEADPAGKAERLRYLSRFQQATGPVMAKGVEDTAFYRYNRLISLNDVGGEPSRFGWSVTAFHRFNQAHARDWPNSLLATSTHDTKRSEDVRARLNVLSELPRDWRAALGRWSRLNARKRVMIGARWAPDRNEEYLLYQTLLGIWPLQPVSDEEWDQLRERVGTFMLKALREAKVNTSWTNQNEEYEQAVQQFVRDVLDRSTANPFLDDVPGLAERVAYFGALNSLSQTMLKLTCPGVPDIYQGQELWDFSLVDPDNRRPVDFDVRGQLLDDVQAGLASLQAKRAAYVGSLLDQWQDGRIKLLVTHALLRLRGEVPAVFESGGYQQLRVEGPCAQHVCAFARSAPGQPTVLVVAPRLLATLQHGSPQAPLGERAWRDTTVRLPAGTRGAFRDVFTDAVPSIEDGRLQLRSSLATLPLSVLVQADA